MAMTPAAAASSTSTSSASSTCGNSTNRLSENIKHWSHISCNLLEAWMNEKVVSDTNSNNKKLIIIDCRSAPEYTHLHIKNALNIGFSKIMRRRLLRDNYPISELLLKNSSNNFIDYQETNVVVYDNQSEHTNQLEADSFALILINKLVQKFKSVSFLTGGFVAFHAKYASLCQPTITPLQGPQGPTVMAISPVSSTASSASASLTTTPNEPSSHSSHASAANANNATATATATPQQPSSVPHGGELTSPAYLNRISQSNLNLQVSSSRYEKICRFRSDFTLLDTFALANMASQNCGNEGVTTRAGADAAASASGSGSEQQSASGMREPTKILDFLYLGSQEDALSQVTMTALNITNVLNVSQTCAKPDFIPDSHFLRIPVNDGHAARLIPFFDVGFRFIEKCRKANTKVIIHCLAGISRSPTLAIAYLMRYLSLNSDEAYNFVKQRRSTISPNLNFVGQLYEYEKQLQASASASNAEKSAAAAAQMTPSGSFESLLKLGSDENNSSSSSSAGVTFLKIKKKLQNSAMPSPSLADSGSQFAAIMNFSNKISSLRSEPDRKTSESERPAAPLPFAAQRFSPPKIQRRKTYMFNPNTTTTTTNNSSSSNAPQNASMSSTSSLCLVQAHTPLCLQSPSTALATFDLNSPTATQHKPSQLESTSTTCHEQQQQQPVAVAHHRCVPKSFTLDTINLSSSSNTNKQFSGTLESLNASIEQRLGEKANTATAVIQAPYVRSAVQMRRPTNFLTNLSPSSPMSASSSSSNMMFSSSSFFSPAFPATKECQSADESTSSANSGDKMATTAMVAAAAAVKPSANDAAKEPPKRLKRPSSFLAGFNKESPGVFMNSPFESIFKSAAAANESGKDSSTTTAASSLSHQSAFETNQRAAGKPGNLAQRSSLSSFVQSNMAQSATATTTTTTTPQNLLNVNNTNSSKSFFARTFSNTSAGSTASSCSCCSNISTTSSALSSSSFSSSSAAAACQCHAIVGGGSQQQQQQQQQENDLTESESKNSSNQQQQQGSFSSTHLKKMKLSPTKDQEMLNMAASRSSESQENDNAMDIAAEGEETPSNSQGQHSSSQLPPASLLFNGGGGCVGRAAKIECRFSSSQQQQILTGSATTPTYINATLPCILNSFSARLNESRSYETIRTLLADPKDGGGGGTNKSLESEDSDEESHGSGKREESVESKLKNSSSSLLSSLVKIMPSNTNKSSSSSSKTGSNKNSLHGSIETMIPVL